MALFRTLRDAKLAWRKSGGLSADKSKFNYNIDGKILNAFTKREVSQAKATEDQREVAETLKTGAAPTPAPTVETAAEIAARAEKRKLADQATGREALASDREFERWLDNNNDLLLEKVANGQISLGAAKRQVNWNSKIGQSAVDALVKEAITTDQTTNLQRKSFWKNQPQSVKEAAFSKLQDIISSPQKIAEYAQSNNLDITKFDFFIESKHIDAASEILEPKKAPTPEEPATPVAEEPADVGEPKYLDENGNEYFGNVFTNPTTGQKTDAFGKPLTLATTDPETGEVVKDEEGKPVTLRALPESVTSSDDFQLLSPDQQGQVLKYFNFMVQTGEEEQKAFLELIDEARAFAEPQFKTEMRFTADAIADNLAAITGDIGISIERFRKNLDEIQADIKSGAEQLTIEEENSLRRQEQNYRNQLDDLASRGLVSSTFRTETEDEKRRVRESTTRQFARTRQQIDRRARAKARELEQQFGTLGSQRILQGQDPITGEAIQGAQNIQQFGLGDFFLGAGAAPDIRGTEEIRRATETFRFAGALEPLSEKLNPLQFE